MATPKKRKPKPTVRFDQDFLDTFDSPIIEVIAGREIHGRYFAIDEWSELKARFPDWQGFNVGDLLLAHGFEAVFEICWLAIKDLNDFIPTKQHLRRAMNAKFFMDWAKIWRPAAGLPTIEEEQAESEAESKNEETETQEEPEI